MMAVLQVERFFVCLFDPSLPRLVDTSCMRTDADEASGELLGFIDNSHLFNPCAFQIFWSFRSLISLQFPDGQVET